MMGAQAGGPGEAHAGGCESRRREQGRGGANEERKPEGGQVGHGSTGGTQHLTPVYNYEVARVRLWVAPIPCVVRGAKWGTGALPS